MYICWHLQQHCYGGRVRGRRAVGRRARGTTARARRPANQVLPLNRLRPCTGRAGVQAAATGAMGSESAPGGGARARARFGACDVRLPDIHPA